MGGYKEIFLVVKEILKEVLLWNHHFEEAIR